MKNYIFTILFSFVFAAGFMFMPAITFALETSFSAAELDHTAREEAEGRSVFEKMQSKEIKCEDLKDEDFQALGEYFMGQMTGAAHPAMNNMITAMHGEEGEHQTHIIMGKRLIGCEINAPFDSKFGGFMPMMNMMTGGWSADSTANYGSYPSKFNSTNNSMMNMMYGLGNNPMSFWGMGFGLVFSVLLWILIIIGVIFFVKWLLQEMRSGNSSISGHEKSALEILKERYARGEIDKQEFEEKKKDFS